MGTPANVLGDDPRPRFFAVRDALGRGLRTGAVEDLDVAVRVWGRSLAGMQKEVLVATSADDTVWRLVSDEGPELNGYDEGPFPLGHMTTGMLASCTTELLALAGQRGVRLDDLRLTLHSYYSMRGSALRGTMVGGALAPQLDVDAATSLDLSAFRQLVCDAVAASPVHGLLRSGLTSRFSLTANGTPVDLGGSGGVGVDVPADPGPCFAGLAVDHRGGLVAQPLVGPVAAASEEPLGTSGAGFAEAQSRVLHVRGVCTVREDGVKQVVQQLVSPVGGTFRALSDEGPSAGGQGRAPDAATYLAAGLAFCFMTQFGRYATITRKQLDDYRLVQDLELSLGGASGGTGRAGAASAVRTHVYLDTPEGEEFARTALTMAEQTCFLHALYRTPLTPRVRATVVG